MLESSSFLRGIFRATISDMRNFRCFSHSSAIVRTGLPIAVDVRKILETKGFFDLSARE